ncbi:MAG: ASKHA domain-containing protein [Clostridiales bacterium]|nr:ASKHA domain-containing protein [Clostridiales bacterium]
MECKFCRECGACKKITGNKIFAIDEYKKFEKQNDFSQNKKGIAIDIGTTTLAFELIDMGTGARIAAHTQANSQRVFGADIISRISNANEGNLASLHKYIKEDVRQGITAVLRQGDVDENEIAQIAIAGNTTMLHILQNFSCKTLGVYPFTPVSVELVRTEWIPRKARQDDDGFSPLVILPGVSAFIGADIVAGIFLCECAETFLLIDLGTNGEMVLSHGGKIFAASAAAGPAFEGGNISTGMASVPGAIACVKFSPEKNVFNYETIENAPPVGIAGTGVIDICAEIFRHGLADKTGLLKSGKKINICDGDSGKISFTQKDIREVQLAKSAVRAGIEILVAEAGISFEKIQKVFLAGGFGYRMNVENAVALGLMPEQLKDKIIPAGNSALGGCAKFLMNPSRENEIIKLAQSIKEINLSEHPKFNELFLHGLTHG